MRNKKNRTETETPVIVVDTTVKSWQNFTIFFSFVIVIMLGVFIGFKENESLKVSRNENLTMDFLMSKAEENQVKVIEKKCDEKLRYWGVCLDDWHDNGSLRTMNRVFKRMNYQSVNASLNDEWDILWMIETVFSRHRQLHPLFAGYHNKTFKKHQKINHFPGNTFLVSKTWMNSINRGEKFILQDFRMPEHFEKLQNFITENPDKKMLQKNFFNRGVKIVDVKSIKKDVEKEGEEEIFYQEFMDNPFLIDGHAFDFGVFVLITSFDPARIYRYSDILLRFCAEKYHPFDPNVRDKYVVREESKTVYEMPSFRNIYKIDGYSSKVMFENHISKRGYDVTAFWERIDEAIVRISLKSEMRIIESMKKRNLKNVNFFELVRFDIILDVDLNPYVVEVNMSPNITPAGEKYEENVLIYEQMVHNVVKMIGGGTFHEFWGRFDSSDILISNKKDLASDITHCTSLDCSKTCNITDCAICTPCMSPDDRHQMKEAVREHQHGSNFQRLFPSPIYFNDENFVRNQTRNNRVSLKWFRGKCRDDEKWC